MCRVGGCDPDVWDYIDDATGWPIDFSFHDDGHVDWPDTIETYPVPDYDNAVFHRRGHDGEGAQWRKVMPKLMAAWALTHGRARYDENGSVPDEEINWGEVEFEDVEEGSVDVIEDEEIEW
jgi:hypothetical protein